MKETVEVPFHNPVRCLATLKTSGILYFYPALVFSSLIDSTRSDSITGVSMIGGSYIEIDMPYTQFKALLEESNAPTNN